MLNVHQISNAATNVSRGRMSVEDFEHWLRRESRNVHAWGKRELVDAVLSVEAVLSEYRFENLEENKVGEELENAIRPFAAAHAISWKRPDSISVLKQTRASTKPRRVRAYRGRQKSRTETLKAVSTNRTRQVFALAV